MIYFFLKLAIPQKTKCAKAFKTLNAFCHLTLYFEWLTDF